MNTQIVKYNASVDHVGYLRSLCRLWEDDFWSFDEILSTLAQRTSHLYLAETLDPSGCVGLVLYRKVMQQTDLVYVYVAPESRRQGLAKQLMQKMIDEVKLQSPGSGSSIFLEVKESNDIAMNLYKSLGFKLIRRIPKYYEDKDDAAVYQLELAKA